MKNMKIDTNVDVILFNGKTSVVFSSEIITPTADLANFPAKIADPNKHGNVYRRVTRRMFTIYNSAFSMRSRNNIRIVLRVISCYCVIRTYRCGLQPLKLVSVD